MEAVKRREELAQSFLRREAQALRSVQTMAAVQRVLHEVLEVEMLEEVRLLDAPTLVEHSVLVAWQASWN